MDDITRHVLKETLAPIVLFILAIVALIVVVFLSGCSPNPVGPDVHGLEGPPVLRLGFEETVATLDTSAKAYCWIQQNARYKNTVELMPQPGEDVAHLQAREFYENNGGSCRGFAAFLVYCARANGRRSGAVYLGGRSAHIQGWAMEKNGLVSWNTNETWFIESYTPDQAFDFFVSYREAGTPISFLDDHFQEIKTDEAALTYMRGN
jgi:hypothetical protein